MVQRDSGWPDRQVLRRLVLEAQQDGTNGLNALLVALRPAFMSFFGSRLPIDDAEDLAQSALIRVVGALRRIDPERADAYVGTVARNLLRTAFRRRATERCRHADVDAMSETLASQPVGSQWEYEELVREVHRVARTGLPEAVAEVVLALLRGETTAEIASRLDVSPVTVRTRLLRARATLRRELPAYAELSQRRESQPEGEDDRGTRLRPRGAQRRAERRVEYCERLDDGDHASGRDGTKVPTVKTVRRER